MVAKFLFFLSNLIILNLNSNLPQNYYNPPYSINLKNPFCQIFSSKIYLYYFFLLIYSFFQTYYDLFHYLKNDMVEEDQFEIDQTILLRKRDIEAQQRIVKIYFPIANFILAVLFTPYKKIFYIPTGKKHLIEKVILAFLLLLLKERGEQIRILLITYLYVLNNILLNLLK